MCSIVEYKTVMSLIKYTAVFFLSFFCLNAVGQKKNSFVKLNVSILDTAFTGKDIMYSAKFSDQIIPDNQYQSDYEFTSSEGKLKFQGTYNHSKYQPVLQIVRIMENTSDTMQIKFLMNPEKCNNFNLNSTLFQAGSFVFECNSINDFDLYSID